MSATQETQPPVPAPARNPSGPAKQADSTSSSNANPYIAQPPGVIGTGDYELIRQLWRLVRVFTQIIVDPLIPRNSEPDKALDPPDHKDELDEAQLEQCIRIYDNVETSRKNLEDKARWTFTMVSFLAPLLLTMLVFMLGKTNVTTTPRMWAFLFAALGGLFLLLGFISIVRAVAVQKREDLFLGAVIDTEKKAFRSYSRTFYARGLLHCASFNAAMNAHIAQFVRGAQVLTALAVISSILAAVPAALVFAEAASSTPSTEIVGSVSVLSPQLDMLRNDVMQMSAELKRLAEQTKTSDDLRALKEKVTELESRLGKPSLSTQTEKPSPKR